MPGNFAFLAALRDGRPLGIAVEAARLDDVGFDVVTALADLVALGIATSINPIGGPS
jgi:hypothetical protein